MKHSNVRSPSVAKHETVKQTEENAILSLSCLPIPLGIVEQELQTLKGVNGVSLNLLSHTVRVSYDPKQISSDEIREFLESMCMRQMLQIHCD
jgi:cation transport ATPase